MISSVDIFYKDALSVIAQFLQRLTLIAFTAHAVLGCCWHHSHPLAQESCERHVHTSERSTAAPCCDHASDPSSGSATPASALLSGSSTIHECDHLGGHSEELAANAESASATLLSVAACPCHHSHDCDEASCSYVPRQANPSDGFLSFPVGDLFPRCGDVFASIHTGSVPAEPDRASVRLVKSSQQRCANLQSWQI